MSGEGPYLHVAAAICWGQYLAHVETKILYLRKSQGDRCGAGCKGRSVIRSFLPRDSFPPRLPGPPHYTSLPSLVRRGVLWCLLLTFEDVFPPTFLPCPFASLFIHIFHEGESDKVGRLSRRLGQSQVGPSPHAAPGPVFETDKVTDGMTEGSEDRREPLIHPGEARARRGDI